MAEEEKWADLNVFKVKEVSKKVTDLRKQLAEAVTKRHKVSKDCDILRQQLAEAKTATLDQMEMTARYLMDRESLEYKNDRLRKQLAEAQAEVEHLRKLVNYYETKYNVEIHKSDITPVKYT